MNRVFTLCALCLVSALALSCNRKEADPFAGRLVDLSHAYDEQTVFWPTAEGFKLEKVADGMTPGGYYYAANNFSMAEHGGTHLDAPVHFAEGRHTADQIPLEQVIAPAVVIDGESKTANDADYRLTADDVRAWESRIGTIAAGTIVLLRTGWGKRYPDRKRYFGDDTPGAVDKLHFPSYGEDAARLLVTERHVAAIGVDTASIDYGQSTLFESHRVLFEQNVPAFENLANLEQLPAQGFHIVALPMKIKGGSGGPLRAVAIVHR
jgi:kynurenine formamidase